MKLSNEQLKKIYYGAYNIIESEEGYLQSYHYTKQQMRYLEECDDFWYDRNKASNGKTLEFNTSATQFSFEYKIPWIGSYDTIELSIDGLITKVVYVKDLKPEGVLTFEMPSYEKHVAVYLSVDAIVLIRNFEIDDDIYPVDKTPKVLWMGDSITQGYGSFRSAHTYVNVANRYLNYDIINQGLGGFIYDKNILENMQGYVPEKIIVSLGSNQYHTTSMKVIEEYYTRLSEMYPNIPVLCITPTWRGDSLDKNHVLKEFGQKTKDICAKYSTITVIDGFKLVPHTFEYFIDEVHPNALGMEIYGRNLVLAIQEAGF
ncbi:MAG: SGNH/GDSL hydrolase family protein [Erysipelothrix sp.]|jgi:lysophospholipase L1-like esterase|nr:SGNH/GDSL hydrolase family protein [Erysipelothrix sp.]